jgi:hypothetical protein
MSSVSIRGPSLEEIVKELNEDVKHQLENRTYRASNELRNASLLVLRGQRGGRRYRVPGTKKYYTASAPGEPPAVRTGAFRLSWQTDPRCSGAFNTYWARIKSDQRTDNGRYTLGDILENGTPGGKIAPRPHHDRILQKAEPSVVKIYNEPYFNG